MEKNKSGQEVKYLKETDIKRIREYLTNENALVFLGIFNFGLNTGLRISDYINLKFEDIDHGIIYLKEKKTKKMKEVPLNKTCLDALSMLKNHYKNQGRELYNKGFIFKSNLAKFNYEKKDVAISYDGLVYYFRKIQKDLKITYPIGTHSMRKTWGRAVYYKTKDIALLMNIFNHSHPRITLRYIGIEQHHFNEIFKKTLI